MAYFGGMGCIPNCSSEKTAQNLFWRPEDWCSFPCPGPESHHHGHLKPYQKFANKQDKTNPFFK